MGQEKPVDLDHLSRYTGGERSLDEEILKLFENQCQDMLAGLERLAAQESGSRAWQEITHTLKGAARGIGAFPLADAAADAETLGGDRTAAIAALQIIKDKAAQVHRFIEHFLTRDS